VQRRNPPPVALDLEAGEHAAEGRHPDRNALGRQPLSATVHGSIPPDREAAVDPDDVAG